MIDVESNALAALFRSPGIANDRLTLTAYIFNDDFPRLGITPGDGFNDEVLNLRIRRNGTELITRRPQFSGNHGDHLTFEVDIWGVDAPELQPGDVASVNVNGNAAFRGKFRKP